MKGLTMILIIDKKEYQQRDRNYFKKQIEFLELKSITTKFKNLQDWLQSKLELAEEIIGKLEERTIDIVQLIEEK